MILISRSLLKSKDGHNLLYLSLFRLRSQHPHPPPPRLSFLRPFQLLWRLSLPRTALYIVPLFPILQHLSRGLCRRTSLKDLPFRTRIHQRPRVGERHDTEKQGGPRRMHLTHNTLLSLRATCRDREDHHREQTHILPEDQCPWTSDPKNSLNHLLIGRLTEPPIPDTLRSRSQAISHNMIHPGIHLKPLHHHHHHCRSLKHFLVQQRSGPPTIRGECSLSRDFNRRSSPFLTPLLNLNLPSLPECPRHSQCHIRSLQLHLL